MSEVPEKDPSICSRCGKEPAKVKVRRVTAESETDLHVCLTCAKELGAEPTASGQAADPITVMFQSMEETSGSGARCPECGMSYSIFKETGRLGCAACYAAFSKELTRLIRRIHGETRHRGKRPTPDDLNASRIRSLTEALERAVVSEDYERAAEIRDRLKKLGESTGAGDA